MQNSSIDPGGPQIRDGAWGPIYATLFGAWFAPWPAAIWAGWALSSYSGAGVIVPAVISGLLTVGLLAVAARLYVRVRPVAVPSYYHSGRFWALFWTVILAEGGLIAVASQILDRTGQSVWILPLILAVVGLHFFPLAYLNHNPIW